MTCDALNRVTGAKNNIDKDALNKKLDERLYDRLDHVQQLLVGPVVLPPITLGEIWLLENSMQKLTKIPAYGRDTLTA